MSAVSSEVKLFECHRCHISRPITLFAENDKLCAYCKADIAESLPAPEQKVEEKVEVETSAQEKARAELALRFLTRKRMLPFVERFNPDYNAGWVHKDVCARLEKFSRDVVDK